jgi:hypothetical protein
MGNAQPLLEAGVMDEDGQWIAGKDLHLGIEAYREELWAPKIRAVLWLRSLSRLIRPRLMDQADGSRG